MKQFPAWFQEKDNGYLVHSAWLAELILHIHVYKIFSNILISATWSIHKIFFAEFFNNLPYFESY